MDMDISMGIHAKSVDMDMDMDGKFYIHGNPADNHHHRYHVACPAMDVAVPTSVLHACRLCTHLPDQCWVVPDVAQLAWRSVPDIWQRGHSGKKVERRCSDGGARFIKWNLLSLFYHLQFNSHFPRKSCYPLVLTPLVLKKYASGDKWFVGWLAFNGPFNTNLVISHVSE